MGREDSRSANNRRRPANYLTLDIEALLKLMLLWVSSGLEPLSVAVGERLVVGQAALDSADVDLGRAQRAGCFDERDVLRGPGLA